MQGVSHTPSGGLIYPQLSHNTPPASYLDNSPNISQGGVKIIITLAKYEQYLVYVIFIVDSDGGYLFIYWILHKKFRYLILRKIIKLLPPDVRF